MLGKRRRSGGGPIRARRKYARTRGRPGGVVPGKTRKAGYYGRYNKGPTSEMKFFDVKRNTFTLGAAGNVIEDSLVKIAQGVGEEERVGRKIFLKKISIRGDVKINTHTDAADAWNRVRLIVFLDKQCNGATATVAQLLEDTEIDSFRNLENSGRFRFLHDKTYSLNATAALGNGTTNDVCEVGKMFKVNCNLDLPVTYNGATGAITEIRSNNIGLMAISDVFTTTGPLIKYVWRARYTD